MYALFLIGGLLVSEVQIPYRGRPADFSGAVGSFRIQSDVQPRLVELDEVMTLTVTITGSGDLSKIEPLDLSGQRGFSDSFHLVGRPRKRTGPETTFEYDLKPKREGFVTVPPVRFNFFEPKSGRFQTVASSSIQVEVLPVEPVDVEQVVAFPAEPTNAAVRYAAIAGIFMLGLAAAAWLLVRRKSHPMPSMDIPPVPANRPTFQREPVAMDRKLSISRNVSGSSADTPLARELERLRNVVSQKLQRPCHAMTTPQLLAALAQAGLQEHADSLKPVLEQIDRYRFVGATADEERERKLAEDLARWMERF